MSRLTSRAVCRAIMDKHGHDLKLGLYGPEGCWNFYSDDDTVGHNLARLYTSTVDVCRLNHLSIEQWVEAFETLFEGEDMTIEGLTQ